MRLKEEKTLIIVEVIILLFVVLSSVFLQIADIKIKNYNDQINLEELKRSQYLQKLTYYSQRTSYWELFDFLDKSNLNVHFEKKAGEVNEENLDIKTRQALKELKSNEINKQAFMLKMININREKTRYYEFTTQEMTGRIESMYKDTPTLFWVDVFLLQRLCFVSQLIGIFLAAILYLHIFKEINKRICKAVSE